VHFKLKFSEEAAQNLKELESNKSKSNILKQVRKTLGLMETNLKHPSLNTHKFDDVKSKLGDVFESYAQNNTPSAYRIFWAYGPIRGELTIISITPHP
jgi:hypothetical protein